MFNFMHEYFQKILACDILQKGKCLFTLALPNPVSLVHVLSIPVFMKWTISQENQRQEMKHLMEITVQLI